MEIPGRVLILRGITAANVAARQAYAQVDPGFASFQAVLTADCTALACIASFPGYSWGPMIRSIVLPASLLLAQLTTPVSPEIAVL